MSSSAGSADALQVFLDNRQQILSLRSGAGAGLEGDTNRIATDDGSDQLVIAKTESARKRNQGKLLLVALLENYCMLYDQSKEQNQQLFFTLCAYLAKMGIIENTDFLEEFSTVRSSYKKAFKELVLKALQTVQELGETSTMILPGAASSILPLVPSPHLGSRLVLPTIPAIPSDITELLDTSNSRFEEEFESAFGRVLHVKNIMDSRHYALKMVQTHSGSGSELAKTLREVKLLADVEHQNIVRYYSSWFQFTSSGKLTGDSDWEGDDDTHSSAASTPDVSSLSSIDDDSIVSLSLHPLSTSTTTTAGRKPLTLFIQMELCELTLQDWIEDLNSQVNSLRRIEGKILHCFLDLLRGIQCIHKKDYIHRDIKPSNIYWKSASLDAHVSLSNLGGRTGSWKLGDFGLATWILSSKKHHEFMSSGYRESVGIGTFTYASPEQLNYKKAACYSHQTDIYSLGIILFELLFPFGSAMERAKVLTALRQGILPEEFLTAQPKEAALILWMMSPDPKMRPMVDDILNLEWFAHISDGQASERDQDRIRALETELQAAKDRIAALEIENTRLRLLADKN
ncbi:Eukaryotic translation initiation factor 2-alpha kinase [Kappamyces sp. JEL0680]|nr:Eukaryotic translation initiation factor 2-alpha kinase [Kappamyces sp. JEL0680]